MVETARQAKLIGDRELEFERVFSGPRQLVWDMWTKPEHVAKWFGPTTFTTTVKEMDVHPGGTWHFCMSSPEWGDAWSKVVYQEIDEPKRLVYKDYFSDAEGNETPDMPSSTVTVTFEELADGKTRMTSHIVYASEQERAQTLEMGMEDGMNETLDKLEELLKAA